MASTSSLSKLDALLRWCSIIGIRIHPDVEIRAQSASGFGVFTKKTYLTSGRTIVKIPRSALLSTQNCTIASSIPHAPYGLQARLSLSLALYSEMLLGEASFWEGYILSLPEGLVDLPCFWEVDDASSMGGLMTENVDRKSASVWMRGSELDHLLNVPGTSRKLLDELRQYYSQDVEPLLNNLGHASTLYGFLRAFSLVSSRAFIVDAYHGLSMVPIADIFNHVQENHVHLESDYDVCPICGSVSTCPHDEENISEEPRSVPRIEEADDFLEMVTNAGIPPDGEVFNTYGEHLSNAQLLSLYGFALDTNDNDVVHLHDFSWVIEVVLASRPHHAASLDIAHLKSIWSDIRRDDYLAINARESDLIAEDSDKEGKFLVDSEGKVSFSLWVLCVILGSALSEEQVGMALGDVFAFLDLQISMEEREDMTDHERDSLAPENLRNVLTPTMVRVSEILVLLCAARRREYLQAQLADPGRAFDETPEDMHRTKGVLQGILSELSILDSCSHHWSRILDIVQNP